MTATEFYNRIRETKDPAGWARYGEEEKAPKGENRPIQIAQSVTKLDEHLEVFEGADALFVRFKR